MLVTAWPAPLMTDPLVARACTGSLNHPYGRAVRGICADKCIPGAPADGLTWTAKAFSWNDKPIMVD